MCGLSRHFILAGKSFSLNNISSYSKKYLEIAYIADKADKRTQNEFAISVEEYKMYLLNLRHVKLLPMTHHINKSLLTFKYEVVLSFGAKWNAKFNPSSDVKSNPIFNIVSPVYTIISQIWSKQKNSELSEDLTISPLL